jgi:hypothetical protein
MHVRPVTAVALAIRPAMAKKDLDCVRTIPLTRSFQSAMLAPRSTDSVVAHHLAKSATDLHGEK